MRYSRKKALDKDGKPKPLKKKKTPILSSSDPRFKAFIMSALRQASRFWKPSQVCLTKARVTRGRYKCEKCCKIVSNKEIKKDHTDPVVPLTGFVSWDNTIERMFVEEDKFGALCELCHKEKTAEETLVRKQNRVVLEQEKGMIQLEEDNPEES
jgi:hypothetical protein